MSHIRPICGARGTGAAVPARRNLTDARESVLIEQCAGAKAMSDRKQRSHEEYAETRRILVLALISGGVTIGSALLLCVLWWAR